MMTRQPSPPRHRRALPRVAEREGLKRGKRLLTLDTAAEGGSSALMRQKGFIYCGTVPD
jgi:hypothetical protein